jgi:hypothetical protein
VVCLSSLGFSLHAQRNYQNFDKTAIPFRKSLRQELLHIDNFNLASDRVVPGIFRPAPSVAVFWFVYDRWGSHYMSEALPTSPSFHRGLYRRICVSILHPRAVNISLWTLLAIKIWWSYGLIYPLRPPLQMVNAAYISLLSPRPIPTNMCQHTAPQGCQYKPGETPNDHRQTTTPERSALDEKCPARHGRWLD